MSTMSQKIDDAFSAVYFLKALLPSCEYKARKSLHKGAGDRSFRKETKETKSASNKQRLVFFLSQEGALFLGLLQKRAIFSKYEQLCGGFCFEIL